jgi:hypothetical protein
LVCDAAANLFAASGKAGFDGGILGCATESRLSR